MGKVITTDLQSMQFIDTLRACGCGYEFTERYRSSQRFQNKLQRDEADTYQDVAEIKLALQLSIEMYFTDMNTLILIVHNIKIIIREFCGQGIVISASYSCPNIDSETGYGENFFLLFFSLSWEMLG